MPQVSVIIPNYNHSKFLKQRIDSVLNQSFKDFEIIILDDCSPDNSREIIELYRNHSNVSHIIYNEINSGSTFKQWNKGVDVAKGDIIWLAESDDVADSSFLEVLVSKFDLNPEVGIVYCQSYRMNDKDQITGSWLSHTKELNEDLFRTDFMMNGVKYIENYLIYVNTIPNASAVLFKKRYYKFVGGTDITVKYCSDWLTWMKILLISDLAFVSQPLNFFRYHENSVIAKAGKKSESNVYPEIYDKTMRTRFGKYLQKNTDYRLIRKKNNSLINDIHGREGLFNLANNKKLKGYINIIQASAMGLTLNFLKILIKGYYSRHIKNSNSI